MVTERRRELRLAGPFEGTWSGASAGHQCRLTDVSTRGCFVFFIGEQSVGSVVHVTFETDDGHPLQVPGSVTKVEPDIGFVVQFWTLLGQDRDRFAAWMKARRSQQAPPA